MSIIIKTKKIVEKGLAKREIVEVKALKREELPDEYLNGLGSSCWGWDGGLNFANGNHIVAGSLVKEDAFQHQLLRIKECGQRLHEINKKIALLKETWQGEETFII